MDKERFIEDNLPGLDPQELRILDLGNSIQVVYGDTLYGYYMKEEGQWKQMGTKK